MLWGSRLGADGCSGEGSLYEWECMVVREHCRIDIGQCRRGGIVTVQMASQCRALRYGYP